MQHFPCVVTNTKIPKCLWDKLNLLANTSVCSDSSQYAILSQSLVQIGLTFWWRCLKTTFLFCVLGSRVLFNFFRKQKQSFSAWSFTRNAFFISFYEGITKKYSFQLGNFKYNKNKKQKLKQKFLTQWFLGFIATQF